MPKKLKILVIGTTDNKGGAATVGWNIGVNLRKLGHEVKYLVGYKFSHSNHVLELKKPFLLNLIDKYSPIKITPLFRYFRSFITSTDIAYGKISEIVSHPWFRQADIIHCHNLHGSYFPLEALVIMTKLKPVVWTLHDMWAITSNCVYSDKKEVWTSGANADRAIMEYPPMLANNAYSLWQQKKDIYAKSQNLTIVTPSIWLLKRVQESILKSFRALTITNGINTNIFQGGNKDQLRDKLGLPVDKKIVVFVAQGGAHDPRKGWNYINELTHTFSSVCFLCIGGKEDKVEKNIKYVANITDPKLLNDYYGASDAFLFTSLAENCPLVVLEALSCGLPVVSFDVGGVAELVTHRENGYIAKYKNQVDLEKGLKWALGLTIKSSTALSRRNITKARQHFDFQVMTSKYLELYKSLL